MMKALTESEIVQLRADTPGCEHLIHFNNAGAALMPLAVINAMHEQVELESRMGGYEAAAAKADDVEDFYVQAAKLIGAKPENIAFAGSATDAYVKALSSITWRAGDTILTTNEDYASNQINFLSLQKHLGVKGHRVASEEEGGLNLIDLEDKMHRLKPRLLAITYVPTNSGLIQPVQQIADIVSRHNCVYLLDACQAVGHLQVDVQTLRCDFLSTTFRKFLRGPRGTGFLYASDKMLQQDAAPLYLDMRGATWTEADAYTLRTDARRFETWEFSYAGLLGSRAALRYATAIGMARIEARIVDLAKYMRAALRSLPRLTVLDRGPALGGIVTFHIPGIDPEQMRSALQQKGINVSVTYASSAVIDFNMKNAPWALRASPHYYNTEAEVNQFINTLSQLL